MTAIKMTRISKILSRNFNKLGIFIATYPWLLIFLTLVISAFSMCGFFFFKMENNFKTLFSVIDSPAMMDQDFVERTFPTNHHDNFDIRRFSKVRNTNRLIITSKDNGSVLRHAVFEETYILDKLIREVEFSHSPIIDPRTNTTKILKYEDICTKYSTGKCYNNPVLDLTKVMQLFEKHRYSMKYPFEMDVYSGTIQEFCSSLGGVEADENGFLRSAKALAIYYFTSPKYDDFVSNWESKLLEMLDKSNFTHIRVSYLSFNMMGDEMQKTATYAIPFFMYSTFAMAVFAFLACSYGDSVVTKSWVGIVGLLVAILSGISGFGFCQYLGIPCAPPSIAILYVILGIGMDDVFVMLEAWKRSDPGRDVVLRMGDTMEHAGPAITISSLTNFICFLIGAAAPLHFSYYFCVYAAVCVLFDYVFTVSVVGAALVLMARAESRPYHAILCVPFDLASKICKNNIIYRIVFFRDDPTKCNEMTKPNFFSNLFAKISTDFTTSWVGRAIIFSVYLVYLGVSLWGLLNINEDFKERDIFFDGSYLKEHFYYHYKYFDSYHMRIHLVITEPIDYWNPEVQNMVENVTTSIENLPFMAEKLLTESWIRYYTRFLDTNKLFFSNSDYTNKTKFIYTLKNVFIKINPYKSYAHDLAFNENLTEITSSRIMLQTATVKDASEIRYTVNALRDVIQKYPFKMIIYHPYFWIADHLNKVAWITITSLVSAVFILLLISLVFIPSLKFCLITGFSIVSIQLGVMGFTTLWNVDLNNVTNVSLIISVGFSIDNISHVLSAYYYSNNVGGAKAKLKHTFGLVGLPIFFGYFSSFIGFFALVLAKSVVYINIFKVIFTVLTIGLAHSIFILPILLMMFDKNDKSASHNTEYSSVTAQISQDINKNFEIQSCA